MTEGRGRADEFNHDVGTDLDPMNEQTKDIANEEGDIVDEEMAILNPENANIIPENEKTV